MVNKDLSSFGSLAIRTNRFSAGFARTNSVIAAELRSEVVQFVSWGNWLPSVARVQRRAYEYLVTAASSRYSGCPASESAVVIHPETAQFFELPINSYIEW